MVPDREADVARSAACGARFAVVDLGSNSVRLVVFDGPARVPVALFNEKVVCALGRGTPTSGRLNPKGRALALKSLARFVALAQAMKVERLDVLATAAVRAATDGPEFVAEVERRFAIRVRVLSGEDEARLAALGVVCGCPDADGLMGDLGGGSLDLVTLDRGAFGAQASLPFGLLWLDEAAESDLGRARRLIDEALADLAWLAAIRGRAIYLVGGAWRTLASIAIKQSRYPLHILDNFALGRRQAEDFLEVMVGLSPRSLEKIPGVSPRRVASLPLAALLLARLLAYAKPARVVFSAHGMREGHFFANLPPAVRAQDPLLGACALLAGRSVRFGLDADELARWMQPLFRKETPAQARLRLAACHLSDIAWADHPNYRGWLAYEKVLHLPLAGLTHVDRAMLALSVSCRYGRNPEIDSVVESLIDEGERRLARIIGLALHLALTLSGGVPGLLSRSRLRVGNRRLALDLAGDDTLVAGEAVERRLQALARALDLRPAVVRAKRRGPAGPRFARGAGAEAVRRGRPGPARRRGP